MRILVSGATGRVGPAVVRRLLDNGHTVRVAGRRPDAAPAGAEYRVCDVTDAEAARDAVRGMEGVIHLAALASPHAGPPEAVFRINAAGTFNVFQAAAAERIPRIVNASSINALGYNYGLTCALPSYFPIDEEHPTYTTDPYSFSKRVVEDIADYFWRRCGLSSVSLRLPWVYDLQRGDGVWFEDRLARERAARERFAALPPSEQAASARRARSAYDAYRAEWVGDDCWRPDRRASGKGKRADEPAAGLGMGGHSNFWTSLDARDAAQVCERGLLADYTGSHVLFVNDSHNGAGMEAETLARLFFPEVIARRRALRGAESLVSIDRARTLLGFEPACSLNRFLADSPP